MNNQTNVVQFLPSSTAPSSHRGQLQCPKCHVVTPAFCDCGVEYIYIRAGELAKRAVMENPDMSDRAIAAEIGVSDKTVAKARRSGAEKSAPRKRTGRDGKKYNGANLNRGKKTTVPDGYNSLSKALLAGLKAERELGSPESGAKAIGLPLSSYQRGRDIILLAQRKDLSPKHATLVQQALDIVDNSQMIARGWEKIRPVAEKIWGRGGHRFGSEQKRLDAFSNSISFVTSACTTAENITIPHLSAEQCDNALRNLKEAGQALIVLARRIKNGGNSRD